MSMIPIVVGFLGTVPEGLKETGGIGDQRTNRDHSDHIPVKFHMNTEKSPGDLERLTVTQTLVENHQLKLVTKTRTE